MMPIRPDLRHFYGRQWHEEIRPRILARAGNKCERCGAPNRKVVLRLFGWWTPGTLPASVWAARARFTDPRPLWFSHGAKIQTSGKDQFIHLPWNACGSDGRPVRQLACFPLTESRRWVYIVLTVAHLNHVAGDDRDDNLAALCQWCHLHLDQQQHKESRCLRKDLARPLLATA